jgi:hypothetical protein
MTQVIDLAQIRFLRQLVMVTMILRRDGDQAFGVVRQLEQLQHCFPVIEDSDSSSQSKLLPQSTLK